MNDSYSALIQAIQDSSNKSLEIIDKVDNFYNNAWSKLVLFGSLLFAVVGILVPFVIQWYQRRTLKLSEATLKNAIESDLRIKLLGEIDAKFKENEKQLKMLNASANSKILFSQARFSLEKGSFKGALGESVTASISSLECNDFRMIQEILDFILNQCLPNLSTEEIGDLKTANVCDLYSFLDELSKKDDRGMFHARIGDVRVTLSKLPITIKQKPDEQAKTNK